jgi:hypothetical protein
VEGGVGVRGCHREGGVRDATHTHLDTLCPLTGERGLSGGRDVEAAVTRWGASWVTC